MIVGSDSEAIGPEKDRPDVIIESEELIEIEDIVMLFEDFEASGPVVSESDPTIIFN